MLAQKIHIRIIQEKHDVLIVRYYGEKTTRVVVGKHFNWPKMKKDVKHFVFICVKCQNMKFNYKVDLDYINPC